MSVVISAFAPVLDVRKTLTPQLRTDRGDSVLLFVDLAGGRQRLGASIFAQVFSQIGDQAADVDAPARLKNFFTAMQRCLQDELLLAYHDRSDGGLFASLAEMAFAGRCGVDVDLTSLCAGGETEALVAALFNEELGVVLQVGSGALDKVEAIFAQAELADALHRLGTVNVEQELRFHAQGQLVYQNTRAELEALWSETSYRLQAMRDNPDCARQEYEQIRANDPGMSAKLGFDPRDDVAAPFIATGIRPRVAILREQGVNSQVEMAACFDRAGFTAVDVHMSDLLAGRTSLADFVGLVVCGGFSYGDVLGAGEGWAKTVLFNSNVREEFQRFFHRPDTFSLGVCNGCQMMSTLRELIPGTEHWPRFVKNASEQFEARFGLVQIQDSPSVLLKGMTGSHMPVAIAHGEGRAEFADADAVQACDSSGLVSLRFVDNHLRVSECYPSNPNGSPRGITGLCSTDGRATILMPHPERVFRSVSNSWHPDDWGEDGPWMRMFRNARVFVG